MEGHIQDGENNLVRPTQAPPETLGYRATRRYVPVEPQKHVLQMDAMLDAPGWLSNFRPELKTLSGLVKLSLAQPSNVRVVVKTLPFDGLAAPRTIAS